MRFFTLISIVGLVPLLANAEDKVAAFPGAEGFGQFARGGRGGETVHVTTLDDSGAGSFRDAVSTPNRVVVFDVGELFGSNRMWRSAAISLWMARRRRARA